MTEQTVREYMRAHDMLPPGGGRVLCACSGGADSTALLRLLRGMEGVEVVCAHFNHRLRGAESDRDEFFVRGLCADLGVELYRGAGSVAAYASEHKLGIEEAARTLRYRFLRKTAREAGCCRIATAHTANDNAETVLLHLIRGAGGRGLSGIPPVRDEIIRPLLNTTRAEVEDYLRRCGLEHMEDGSNADILFARNRLRLSVFPVLEGLNARAVENICAAAALLGEDEAFFQGLAESFIAENAEDGSLPVSALLELPKSAAMRVFLKYRPGAGREHFEALYALCRDGAARAALDLPGGRVAREYDRLYFDLDVPPAPLFKIPRRELRVGETTLFPELGRAVKCSLAEYPKEIYSSFNTFYFQSEKICGKIYAASREPGDQIRLFGRGCTKSVKKLFSEAKMPLAERARTLVFSDGLGPVAVAGFGVAERCAPVPGKPALKIEIL